jgi:hypothetical protein
MGQGSLAGSDSPEPPYFEQGLTAANFGNVFGPNDDWFAGLTISPQAANWAGYLQVVPGQEYTAVLIGKTTTGGFDPILRVYSTPYRGPLANNLYSSANFTLLGTNDDGYGSLNSILRFTAAPDTTYIALATGFGGSVDDGAFEISYDSVGNTISSALNIGTLSNSGYSFNDFVGYGDKEDYWLS